MNIGKLLTILASPAAVAITVWSVIGRLLWAIWSARYAWARSIVCRHCREVIALVRAWRCNCGFTYVGSVLRRCPVCFGRPMMVRCDNCGMTWMVR